MLLSTRDRKDGRCYNGWAASEAQVVVLGETAEVGQVGVVLVLRAVVCVTAGLAALGVVAGGRSRA